MKLEQIPLLNKEKRKEKHYLRRWIGIGALALGSTLALHTVVSADSPEQIRGTVPVTVAPGDTLTSIMNSTDPNVNTATQTEILTNLENQVTKIDERVAKDEGYSINPNSINPNNIIPGEQLQVPVVNNTGNAVNSSTKQP